MNISDEFISELKEKNDICDIISQYVDLSHKGRNLMGICPFHAEKTASFCVYPNSSSFYCFGCGVGGDVISFIRLIENYDYIEAVKYLSDRAGLNFEISNEEDINYKKKLIIYEINRESAKFYHKCLMDKQGEKAREYLSSRGINKNIIIRFGLGYSPENKFSLLDYLRQKNYNIEDILLSNMIYKSRNLKHIDRFFDRFYNRLMFPIIDIRGNVVGFGARSLTGEIPKYINTSDTMIFKKSNNLFGLNFAVKSNLENLILAEGYMDVISLHQAGFKNSVATLGTALTDSQAKLISRYTEEVILSYDSDEAGRKASDRATKILKDNNLKVKIISLPDCKDPDEYLKKHGKNAKLKFSNLIQNSKNDIEHKLFLLKSECDMSSSDGKIKYLTESSKILAFCKNKIEREVHALSISNEIGVSKSVILIQINKYIKQNLNKNKTQEFKNITKITSGFNDNINKQKYNNLRACIAEENIISYIINNFDKYNKKIINLLNNNNLHENLFITDFNKKVFVSIKNIIMSGKKLDISSICNNYNSEFSIKEVGRITKIACNYNTNINHENSIHEYINILTEEHEKQKLKNTNNISELEIQNYIKKLKK